MERFGTALKRIADVGLSRFELSVLYRRKERAENGKPVIVEVKDMFEELIPKLRNARCIGIFAHTNPDGDAMGSAYSLKLALQSLGKRAEVYLCPNADGMAKKLAAGKQDSGLEKEDCDLLAAVDCGDADRLGIFRDFFLSHENTIAIDHHITHQPFAGAQVVRDISSCCELMVNLYREMGISLTLEMAQNLYMGMVSDTGNFKYSCVTGDTLRTAAELLETGIDFAGISKKLFDTKSAEYYKLMRTALDRLAFYADGQIAVLYLGQEDFEAAGLDEFRAVGIVTLPTSVEGVEAGVYVRGRGAGEYKVSLRSVNRVDVAAVASALGGGGHVRASGYTVSQMPPEDIIKRAVEEIQKQL